MDKIKLSLCRMVLAIVLVAGTCFTAVTPAFAADDDVAAEAAQQQAAGADATAAATEQAQDTQASESEASTEPTPEASVAADEGAQVSVAPEDEGLDGVVVLASGGTITPQATVDCAITLLDSVSSAPIAGVTFEFFKIDPITAAKTSLGTAVTNASGVASVPVSETGRYEAWYVSGLSGSHYNEAQLASLGYEITVSENPLITTDGIQLTEEWALDMSGLRFRDIIPSDVGAVMTGGITGGTVTIPGTDTWDGNPITLDPADGKGVLVKVDSSTGKVLWAKQFTSNYASYSVVDVNGTLALIDYNKVGTDPGARVYLYDTDGNQTGSFPVTTTWRHFDIAATADGCVAVTGDGNTIGKYDLAGNQIWITPSLTSGSRSPAKALIEASNGSYVMSGGGEGAGNFVGNYSVADDGTPTTNWYFALTNATWNSRFNDVIESVEGGQRYYIASGDFCMPVGTATYTIPGSDTVSGNPITLDCNANGSKSAIIVKLDENGKVVWAQTVFGSDVSGPEQEFNSVVVASDELGGYVVSGKLSGDATISAANSILGITEHIICSDNTSSDAVVLRFNTDGKYIDKYLFGTAGADDEYYGIGSAGGKVWAVGSDADKNVVQFGSALTSTPRPIYAPLATKFKLVTGVNDINGGTISGQGWTYYEEVEDGGLTTKPIEITPNAGWYLERVEVNGIIVDTPFTTSSYTVSPITMDSDKTVMAYFTQGAVPSYTVTFESNGGSAVDSQVVTAGGLVTRPADPTRAGYTFAGWYADSELTTEWNFDSFAVLGDVTIYAKWTPTTTAKTSVMPKTGDAALPFMALTGLLLMGAGAFMFSRRRVEER